MSSAGGAGAVSVAGSGVAATTGGPYRCLRRPLRRATLPGVAAPLPVGGPVDRDGTVRTGDETRWLLRSRLPLPFTAVATARLLVGRCAGAT
jgi:hypothetical protein